MRVLVAESHPVMRFGLKSLLHETGGAWVVGETGNGEEALRLANELRPDLVVLGLNLTGDTNGVETCRRIKALPESPRVLLHFAYNLLDDVSLYLLAGADGYLRGSACCGEVLETVRGTTVGEPAWCSQRDEEPRSLSTRDSKGGNLTPKEREVLALMLRGCSNAEMTENLYLGLPTVKTHIRNILRKLGAKNRTDLFVRYLPRSSYF